MTHLSRATVVIALNALRQKGLLDWKSGGPSKRRGKYGQVLANDYTLKLPSRGEKSKMQENGHVQQLDIAMSSSKTPTEIITTDNTSETTSPIPNRSVSDSVSDFDKAFSLTPLWHIKSCFRQLPCFFILDSIPVRSASSCAGTCRRLVGGTSPRAVRFALDGYFAGARQARKSRKRFVQTFFMTMV